MNAKFAKKANFLEERMTEKLGIVPFNVQTAIFLIQKLEIVRIAMYIVRHAMDLLRMIARLPPQHLQCTRLQ